MSVSITTNYGGEVLNQIMTKIATGNEAVEQGHVRVEDQIGSKLSLPRMELTNILQDDAATPVSGGTATFTERALIPNPFIGYLEWLPDQFKAYWRQYQPTGNLVFQTLPMALQVAILDELAVVIGTQVGDLIWQGDTSTGGALRHFNGIITTALADSDVLDVSSPLTLSAANILAEMGRAYDDVPYVVKRHKDFKIFVSDATGEFYLDANIALAQKGPSHLDAVPPLTFKGRPVVIQKGMPDDTMLLTYASGERTSNLWFGVDWNYNDYTSAVLVDRVSNNSDLYFAKMRMKGDTQIAWGEHVVLYGT